MALNKTTLKQALETSLSGYPATVGEAAEAWADAYETYSAGAASCQAVGPDSLSGAKATLQAALETAFQNGTASGAATAMANAFTAFWLSPPIVFTGATVGTVTAVGGTAALTSALAAQFANNASSGASFAAAAQGFADVLDDFTKTVTVAHAAPSACTETLI